MGKTKAFFVFKEEYYKSKFDEIAWSQKGTMRGIRDMQANFLSIAESQYEARIQSISGTSQDTNAVLSNQEKIIMQLLNELAFVDAIANELSNELGSKKRAP